MPSATRERVADALLSPASSNMDKTILSDHHNGKHIARLTVDKTRDGAERRIRGPGSGALRQCDGIMIKTKKGWPSWRPQPAQVQAALR